ncbi:MAG TPA: hypothetical protein VE155_05985, partial [Pseudonocardiaceae bacterium]|nr:hypothetical protein [Pseudonocardiaceae bacterium]
QRSLSDREGWGGPDPKQVGLLLPEVAVVVAGELSAGRPPLALPPDILPFVLADRASWRRFGGVGLLNTARHTNPRGHVEISSFVLALTLLARWYMYPMAQRRHIDIEVYTGAEADRRLAAYANTATGDER